MKRTVCLPALTAAGLALLTAGAAQAETIEEYAAKCDAAVGASVPDFDCDAGTLVPTTNHANGKCDQPNRLERVCDPNSRFTVLLRSGPVEIVAMCRKKGNAAGEYGDIAVIQRNSANGATCFYQSLLMDGLKGQVKAPKKGLAAWTWSTPMETAGIGCAGCHDNGGLIRSPYLTTFTGINAIPGRGSTNYNKSEPYHFIGADFSPWKTYKVEVGNVCTNCHRMAVNNIRFGQGTAWDLGIRATATSEQAKNNHSSASPIWMLPGQVTFNQNTHNQAIAVKACADQFNEFSLPNTPSCTISRVSTSEFDRPSPPPPVQYAESRIIATEFFKVKKRAPTDGEYLRALYFLRGGGTQANLGRLFQQDDMILLGSASLAGIPMLGSNGDATFTYTNSSVGDFDDWAAISGVRLPGDFDRDGRSDIALVGVSGWGSVPVARSTGSGNFTITNSTTADFPAWSAAASHRIVGDFNRDGRADIVLAGGPGWTTMPVAFSNGNGSFNVTNGTADFMNGTTFGAPGVLAFPGDFNLDGRTDIAFTGGSNWVTMPIFISRGDGTFGISFPEVFDFPGWSSTPGVKRLVGDFDGDGRSDVALVGIGGWGSIPVALADGLGGFRRVNMVDQPNFPPWSATAGVTPLVGDFNNDGKSDIALVGGPGWQSIPVAFSDGDGTFTTTNQTVSSFPGQANVSGAKPLVGDFDRDGKSDIALIGGSGVTTLPMALSTSTAKQGTFTFRNPSAPNFTSKATVSSSVVGLGGNFR